MVGPTRRQFLTRVGAVGGFGATYSAMLALGLIPGAAYAGPPKLARAAGAKPPKIVILGAGIAGLVAAYELDKAGYGIVVLEARDRVGGRNWSVRRGTRIELNDGTSQTADFAEGHYFNAGPARLPSHHQGMLGYCREFQVPLEVEVNSSRGALLQNDAANGGKPIQIRRATNDARGHVSELLAKAINRGSLDQEMTGSDKDRIIAFLRMYGDLASDFSYKGSERSGYRVTPGAAGQRGVPVDPLDMRLLLDEDLWNGVLFDEFIVMQPTMFQPVGGMDRVPAAFGKRLEKHIRQGVEVTQIRKRPDGVSIVYRDLKTRKTESIAADYCIVTLPLPVLAKIDTDLGPNYKAAIAGAVYDHACKVAFESPRFWEREQIYGGISFIKRETALVWYPSAGFHAPDGVLVAAYNTGDAARAFGEKSIDQQIASARESVEHLHPGHGGDLRKPMAIAWSKVPYSLGPWIHWDESETDQAAYTLLNQPDDRIYLAGAHLSQMPGWQEGGLLSAQRVVTELSERAARAHL